MRRHDCPGTGFDSLRQAAKNRQSTALAGFDTPGAMMGTMVPSQPAERERRLAEK